MFNEEFETWLVPGEENKRRVWHKRTKVVLATFNTNCAEGCILFTMLGKRIGDCGGTLYDLDKEDYLI